MIPGRVDFDVFRGDTERLVVILFEPVMGTTDSTPVILRGRELRWKITPPDSPAGVLSSADGGVKFIDPYGCYYIDLDSAFTMRLPIIFPSKYNITIIDGDKTETWLAGIITTRSI